MGEAIFQQRSGYLGVGIVGRCGLLTPNQLAGLGDQPAPWSAGTVR